MAAAKQGGGQRRAQLNPQAAGDPIAKGAESASKGPRKAEDAAREAKAEGEDVVMAIVPHTFRLTTDDHAQTEYKEGTQPMPLSHFEHPYAQANGVKRYKGD